MTNPIHPSFKVSQHTPTFIGTPYSPTQIRNAYHFTHFQTGKDKTIAIIVAYGNPNIVSDLQIFNTRFKLPPADLTIVYPGGVPTSSDANWALETALDVEWVHATAPDAKILLVVAQDATTDSLFAAIDYAVQYGVDVISMSWGSDEFPEELTLDPHFNIPNVIFLAASGNTNIPSYPAASPYVLGVGGTSLQLDAWGNRIAPEIAWFFSGGGISPYEAKPSWQTQSGSMPPSTNRTIPDVSLLADPYPGLYVYTSIPIDSYVGWLAVGGTSAATVIWAGITSSLLTPPVTQLQFFTTLYRLAGPMCYTNPFYAYNDVENGNNGHYPALAGYDYVTGLGSPYVCSLYEAFTNIHCPSCCSCTSPSPCTSPDPCVSSAPCTPPCH